MCYFILQCLAIVIKKLRSVKLSDHSDDHVLAQIKKQNYERKTLFIFFFPKNEDQTPPRLRC